MYLLIIDISIQLYCYTHHACINQSKNHLLTIDNYTETFNFERAPALTEVTLPSLATTYQD